MRHMRFLLLLLLFIFYICAQLAVAAPPRFHAEFGTATSDWQAVQGLAVADSAVMHENHASIRVESRGDTGALVLSAPVTLVLGRRYELSGWARTENLRVHDAGRSPIATGAALAMASMPFDVHSQSLGGTRAWTRLTLRFTATRSDDRIVLAIADGGRFSGKAWFSGVSVDEASPSDPWPAKAAVKTFGHAYRYPVGGWVYLHIEGQPYERGYQHGFLMAKEIPQYIDRCAAQVDPGSKSAAWDFARTTANALFLRGFDKEILEEMKGIADGAAAAGAKWKGRPVDLIDIVTANTTVELGELRSAMPMTPSGLEMLHLEPPAYFDRHRDTLAGEHCSAFCATGKATRDGRMVIGHITMWPLSLAEQTNVMLDVQPARGQGHRVLMQSYPGGIESGTDWYQNDAGVVLTETTIRQGPFNAQGTPVAYRARKAIQYGDNIDQVVQHLGKNNNGLYANEWLIGDAKNNEIAMYELGTYKTRLYRSARNDWFGGTEGFYWGCNNAKDLQIRLEYAPDPKGDPEHLPFVPTDRDIRWQELYEKYRGQIDEQFGFLAFRTAPLVSSTSMDAKVATAEMASHLMTWAVFGKPNQREWLPNEWQKRQYSASTGLFSGGYRVIDAQESETLRTAVAENEKNRVAKKSDASSADANSVTQAGAYSDRIWKGWILPAADGDIWLTAGAAAYARVLAGKDLDKRLDELRADYRDAVTGDDDRPLAAVHSDVRSNAWFRMTRSKGALALDALRRQMGDDAFLTLMRDFFDANSTKTVTTAQFEAAAGPQGKALLDTWVTRVGLTDVPSGPIYRGASLFAHLPSAIIVYGTVAEAGANRYAAEQWQSRMLDWFENAAPVRKDFEVSDDDLKTRDVIFVGRPETNSALARWSRRLGLEYEQAAFRIENQEHASEHEALMLAATNPLDMKHMVLVLAGNSPLETVRLTRNRPAETEYAVYDSGKQTSSGFIGAKRSNKTP